MQLLFVLLQLWTFVAAITDETPQHSENCNGSTFTAPVVPGAKVLSITAEAKRNVDMPATPGLFQPLSDLNFCEIKVYLAHEGSDDKVLVQTWLPLSQDFWNDRFQATGGGAWATGMLDIALGPAIASGYAASSTDGGHLFDFLAADWMLNEDKSINWDLVHNFATRSLAEQVYVGRSLTEQFYGRQPRYSYWNGCSQGGRQGFAMAQRYPGLLDGVLAAAPALKLLDVVLSGIWPIVAMQEAGTLVSNCEFDWFASMALEECDILDGAKDGVIGDPEACRFDPLSVIGQKMECSGHKIEVTGAMADVVRRIHQGPTTPYDINIFPGLPHGTPLNAILNITIDSYGVRTLNDPTALDVFPRAILLKDLTFNVSKLTTSEFFALWVQANEEYGWILDTDNSDLSAFRDTGAKLLSWHGISDPIIPYQNTIRYRQRVERDMGGTKAVDDYFRLFLAPGVGHCGLGVGPVPIDPLESLKDWVEKGEPPETLTSETKNQDGELVTRDLCRYPRKPRYLATGDINEASSWGCEDDLASGLEDALL
ncbi:tannase [Pyrenophora tritici-repentis]|uniref:Carboxylic ester hydrolase n=1 Tax=Pyrenophora tritici-repentis TaxID=45151 RepID=A0A2W1E3R1_9PLEO|nr:tannase [Pyrenophora tritici-repentis]KAF7454890.1 tannase [Pyrenophora tritici-repentis]KAF7578036.1 putative tannase [Pyrenophora tritici-repentis]KAG9388646.1 tannase [Pyrenophora tritici-repentis]KAI0579198.1 tannase [Pyrenophora tritici-repentis]